MVRPVKVSPNAPCPCGRDAKLKRCCGPYIQGRPAPPPALVRARFSAYATGKVRFLMDTTDPDGPRAPADRAAWRTQLRDYCRRARFESLEIFEHEIDEAADRAWVSFAVRLTLDGEPAGFRERSEFRRHGGRWLYHDGKLSG